MLNIEHLWSTNAGDEALKNLEGYKYNCLASDNKYLPLYCGTSREKNLFTIDGTQQKFVFYPDIRDWEDISNVGDGYSREDRQSYFLRYFSSRNRPYKMIFDKFEICIAKGCVYDAQTKEFLLCMATTAVEEFSKDLWFYEYKNHSVINILLNEKVFELNKYNEFYDYLVETGILKRGLTMYPMKVVDSEFFEENVVKQLEDVSHTIKNLEDISVLKEDFLRLVHLSNSDIVEYISNNPLDIIDDVPDYELLDIIDDVEELVI